MNSNFLSMPHHLGEGTTLFKLKLIPSGDLTIRYYRAFFSLVRKDRGYMGKGLSHLEVQAEIFGGEIIQCLQFTLKHFSQEADIAAMTMVLWLFGKLVLVFYRC